MDVLLIAVNAKYIHPNHAVRLLKVNSLLDVDFLEYTLKDSMTAILDDITAKKPKLVGLSVYIWNASFMIDLAHAIKKQLGLPVLLGGPEVSYDAAYYLKATHADAILCGEGETDFDAVSSALLNGTTDTTLASVAWRHHPVDVSTMPQAQADLATLKSPYPHGSDLEDLSHKIAYVEASRGCPYACSFCLSSLEKGVRFFPLEQVLDTLDAMQAAQAKTFKFLDRTFNASRLTKAIIDHIVATHEKGAVYQFEITGDILDPSLIEHIHRVAPKGLFRFEVGIQSIHESVNKRVFRHQNIARLFKTLKTLIEQDIVTLHLDLIAGLPGETLAMFKETFDKTYRLGAQELQLGVLKLLRGTLLREQAPQYGMVFDSEPPYTIEQTKWLSAADLETILHVEAMLNLFHNRGLLGNFVYTVLNAMPSPFAAFLSLHDHAVNHGLDPHRYQLEAVYTVFDAFLKSHHLEEESAKLRRIYLLRAKVKPPCYFPLVTDRTCMRHVYEYLAKTHQLPVQLFYKHARLIEEKAGYVAVLYQNQTATLYTCPHGAWET